VAYEFEDGADYFESDVDIAFEDLEGAQVIASLEPRKFKEGEPATGTRTVSSTLMMPEAAEKVVAKAEAEEAADFSDIPF
jgi:hypothetical protein